MSIRQNVRFDPPIISYSQCIQDTTGIPSDIWHQQMEGAYIQTYKFVHNNRLHRFNETDHTTDSETRFPPLQRIADFNPQYFDHDFGTDPYIDESLFDKQKLHSNATIILQRTTRTIPR